MERCVAVPGVQPKLSLSLIDNVLRPHSAHGRKRALPVINFAVLPDQYKAIMDISLAVINCYDALLLIAESRGANRERDLILSKGLPVYKSLDEIPEI